MWGYAHFWLILLNAPCPGLHVPHAMCLFHAADSLASESELLLTCPTPTHNQQLTSGSAMYGLVLMIQCFMVFLSTKVANIRQQGNQALLCICVWLNSANHYQDSSAMTDHRWKFSTLDWHRKLYQLRWQIMSTYLTNETSYQQKELQMHRTSAIYNACDLNINLHVWVFFSDLVTCSGPANPVPTARGLSTTYKNTSHTIGSSVDPWCEIKCFDLVHALVWLALCALGPAYDVNIYNKQSSIWRFCVE